MSARSGVPLAGSLESSVMTLIPTGQRAPDARVDTLIIGGGVAGYRAAIEAARDGGEVLVITKDGVRESATAYAQGGVAAVLGAEDSVDAHREDTERAGAGLCDSESVEAVVSEGPSRVHELLEWGGEFDRDGDALHLTREGGHRHHRVAHAHGDATGREFVTTLLRAVRQSDGIQLWENAFAIDFIVEEGRCVGVTLIRDGRPEVVCARTTILCTGGAGQIFRETTNPAVATGDGHAMALRAGVEIADMEFVQFHPTTLYIAGAARHLITEAVRGEGGRLIDERGDRFTFNYHPDGELAPRDVVSRAIVQHLATIGDVCVYLDLRHLGEGTRERFPGIDRTCRLYNLDIRSDLIPVHPSAHYMIGGCLTDLDGRTSLPGLLAAGEASSSGLHGANRLASNSLLEGLVFGRRAGACAAQSDGPVADSVSLTAPDRPLPASVLNVGDLKNSIRSLMWRSAGILRTGEGLERALAKLRTWQAYVHQVALRNAEALEMQNMLAVAAAVVRGAGWRKESRGTHYRTDHPERDDVRNRARCVQGREEDVVERPLGRT